MATRDYMNGRRKYFRPQAVLWSNNPGTLVDGLYTPRGTEIGSYSGSETDPELIDQFLILSDHNRSPINFTNNRIEKRERMINGRMRSYHIADKLNISMSWENLPSRAFALPADFDANGKSEFTGGSGFPNQQQTEFTADGGAGGVELLDWYNNHQGSFWMFLAYDNYANFNKTESAFGRLDQYNEIVEVFFSSFDYTVSKRGKGTDLWNVNLTLEEA